MEWVLGLIIVLLIIIVGSVWATAQAIASKLDDQSAYFGHMYERQGTVSERLQDIERKQREFQGDVAKLLDMFSPKD